MKTLFPVLRSPLPILPLVGICASSTVRAETELWGESGESWEPASVLPDFSFAGFESGGEPLPERAPVISVADFGAIPGADATAAFKEAIAAGAGKCIGIPAGRYILSDRLHLTAPGTILQGHGPGKTELHFTRGFQEIEPRETSTGHGSKTTPWSWSGGVISVGSSSLESAPKVRITSSPKRGARSFSVEDARQFPVGATLIVSQDDDPAGSLTSYLYRGDPGDYSNIKGKTRARQVAKVVNVEGSEITINRPLRHDLRPAWNPTAAAFKPRSHHVGLEGITITFPPVPYRGHWLEDGLNGVAVSGAHNWVRDVEIRDCDSGIYVSGHFNTIDGVKIVAGRKPHASGNTGHHGLTATGHDCLITRFEIKTKFFHDLTLDAGASGNVFSNGSGEDLCFDHHRFAPYENLFTAIHVGSGTRPWSSGGTPTKGRHTAAGAVFWNIDSDRRFDLPKEGFGPGGLVFVGLNTGTVRKSNLPEGWHYEKGRAGETEPVDLHQAQLRRRQGGSAAEDGAGSTTGADLYHRWTNSEGVTIEARFLGGTAEAVKLQLRDGRTVEYPLAMLDAASRDLARSLSGAN